jgi:hypothetical protein
MSAIFASNLCNVAKIWQNFDLIFQELKIIVIEIILKTVIVVIGIYSIKFFLWVTFTCRQLYILFPFFRKDLVVDIISFKHVE